jgi:hypothetical protein
VYNQLSGAKLVGDYQLKLASKEHTDDPLAVLSKQLHDAVVVNDMHATNDCQDEGVDDTVEFLRAHKIHAVPKAEAEDCTDVHMACHILVVLEDLQ